MELCPSCTPSASRFDAHDVARGCSPLGLDELVSGAPTRRCAAGAPIVLNGLRLHRNAAPADERSARQSASEGRLAALADDLCAPFRSHDDYILELSEIETGIAPIDSRARSVARTLMRCGYGLRYLSGTDPALEEFDDTRLERAGEASTVVAIAPQLSVPQVIGTLRFIVGERLSLFDFFAPEPTTCWPHGFGKPAELTRLAFHPVFDRMVRAVGALQRDLTRFYKVLVLRKLIARCAEESLRRGARVIYLIAAPHVARFLSLGGLHLEPLPGARPVESEFAAGVRNAFPRYWRPASDQQPLPYLLGADLDEITVRIGQQHIVIAPDNSLRVAALHEDRFAAAAA